MNAEEIQNHNETQLKADMYNQRLIGGSSLGYYPQPTLYVPPNPRQLTIEAVEGGYLISGNFGKGHSRTVAVSAKGLTGVLKSWSAQFEVKAQ